MKTFNLKVATAMALSSLVALATGCGAPVNTAPIYPLENGVLMGGAGCITAQAALNSTGYSLNFSGTNNIFDGYEILGGQISSLDAEPTVTNLWGTTFGITVQNGKFAGQSYGKLDITGDGNAGAAVAGMLSQSGPDGQIMVNLGGFDNTAGSYGTAGQKINLTGSVIISAQKMAMIAAVMGWNAGAGVYSGKGPQASVAQRLCFSGAAVSMYVNINNAPGSQLPGGRFYLYPTALKAVVAAGANATAQPIILQF